MWGSFLAGLMAAGCGGPGEGEALEPADAKGGQAQGRLGTDQGAEQGQSGGGESTEKPSAEPVPSGS